MGVSVLLRLFISNNVVCNTAYALYRIHEQNSIFKYTTLGRMIPKEMKYNLHYGNVRGKVSHKILSLKTSFYVKAQNVQNVQTIKVKSSLT